MGQEISYCLNCQNQLRSIDFEKGKAFKLLGLEAVCEDCAPDALKTLPPEKVQALQRAMGGPPPTTPRRGTERMPLASSTPKRGTERVPMATGSSSRKIPTVEDGKNLRSVMLFVAFIAVAILGALFALSGKQPAETTPRAATPSPTPDTPIIIPAAETARDRATKESLRKAQLFVDSNPKEYLEQIRLFEQAAIDAKGTAFENDVNKALEGARRRVSEAASAELRAIDDLARAASAKEDFKRAIEIYDEARKRPITADWSGELDRRIQDVHAKMDSAYGRIRTQAIVAKPGSDEVKALRERVARWGQERLLTDLDQALAAAAAPKPAPVPNPAPPPPLPPDAPKPPPAPDPETLAKAWNAALLLAHGRDFAGAVQELERVGPAHVAADLEILRSVGALHADAIQALAKMPAGRKVAVSFIDYDNNPQRVEGSLARVRSGTIEIGKGKPFPQWPLGMITIRSLSEFAAGRSKVTAAIACLIEGDLAGAKELAGGENNPAIPARYWKWAAEVPTLLDEATRKKDGDAKYIYYFAVMNQGAPSLRADAAVKCRKLLEESGTLPWVRRNRAMLAAVADTTREYMAGPTTLHGSGMFRLEVPKTLPYWMSSIDIDPAKRRENYVEMEFSALPDATYRAWAYVGACCSESLVFWSQTTDLAGAEPGSEPDAPVKHAMTSAIKNHSGHAGRKGPSRWGWVELPLPKYEKPGAKVLRLLSQTQGFSVAWVVVSSLRDKPPADAESKDWERDLVHNPGPAGPTIGLAAWFKADAGTAIEGGKIAQWQDQSGHARHALQLNPAARPTLAAGAVGGKPAVRFDGAANSLSFECPANAQQAMTIFMVAAASKNQRGNELGNYAALQWPEFGPWGNVFLGPQQTCVAWRFGSGEFGNVNLWERPNGQPQGWTVTAVRKEGAKEDLFVQGQLVASNPKPRYLSTAHTLDTATIGAGNDGRGNAFKFFPGDIAEILVYTRALPEAERDAIERYLRGKYGL